MRVSTQYASFSVNNKSSKHSGHVVDTNFKEVAVMSKSSYYAIYFWKPLFPPSIYKHSVLLKGLSESATRGFRDYSPVQKSALLTDIYHYHSTGSQNEAPR